MAESYVIHTMFVAELMRLISRDERRRKKIRLIVLIGSLALGVIGLSMLVYFHRFWRPKDADAPVTTGGGDDDDDDHDDR